MHAHGHSLFESSKLAGMRLIQHQTIMGSPRPAPEHFMFMLYFQSVSVTFCLCPLAVLVAYLLNNELA